MKLLLASLTGFTCLAFTLNFSSKNKNQFVNSQHCAPVVKCEQPICKKRSCIEIDSANTIFDEPYKLTVNLRKDSANEYSLFVNMELDSGVYFMSSNSKYQYIGAMNIYMMPNEYMVMNEAFYEFPKSLPEYDIYRGDFSYFVRENTIIQKKIIIKTTEDFETNANIQFTIEPRCTMEFFGINLSYKNGVLSSEIERLEWGINSGNGGC